MDAGIWGFIGVIIGAFSSIVTTVMVTRSNRLLQREASSFEREEMRREFQRNNLIELQDLLTNIMRLVAHIVSSNKLAEDSNHKMMTFNRDINVRMERITDDSLRESVRRFQHEMTAFLLSEELTLTNKLPNELVTSFKQKMENIGVALRSY
jgi:thiamine monophosphate kinase